MEAEREASKFYRHKVRADEDPAWALTFEEVIGRPEFTAYNILEVKPDMSTRIGPYTLRYPFISAAMDTVTEAEMAIAMANEGGLGVIHRNLPLRKQLELVKQVKRSRSYMAQNLVKISPDASVEDARQTMKKYRISGLMVVNKKEQLVGVVSKRDVLVPSVLNDKYVFVSDVMTPKEKLLLGKKGMTVDEAEKLMYEGDGRVSGRKEKLPFVNDDGTVEGVMTLKDLHTEHPYASLDKEGRLLCGLGMSPFKPKKDADLKVLQEIANHVDIFFTDVADFYKEPDIEGARQLMEELGGKWVVGNVGTYEAAEYLITKAKFPEGALVGIKVGMGSGSICTTTIQTGFGAPTVYATASVADALRTHGLEGKVALIADGGFKYPGDFAKAFIAGATATMSGSFYAGCTEAPGFLSSMDGRKVKVYRGMGSAEARSAGRLGDRYSNNGGKSIAEGVSGYVPYVGDVADVIAEQVSALKQGMGYGGAVKLDELHNCTFLLANLAGRADAGAHTKILR